MEATMSSTPTTAATFREPLLRALGTLSGLVAGKIVKADDAMAEVCKATGIAEDAFGKDSEGKPHVRLWITQAFNRKLKEQGLADAPAGTRGKWMLTDEGVKAAAILLGQPVPQPALVAPIPVATTTLPPVMATPDLDSLIDAVGDGSTSTPAPAPVAAPAPTLPEPVAPGGEGLAWDIGEQVNTYNPDPYIRGLAVAATACIGLWSSRSDVCGKCSISGACKATAMGKLSEVARKLTARDALAKAKAAQPPTPQAPQATQTVVSSKDDDLDIDEIMAAISGDDTSTVAKPKRPDFAEMDVPAHSKCPKCTLRVEQGSKGYWVKGEGMYHPACFDAKYPK